MESTIENQITQFYLGKTDEIQDQRRLLYIFSKIMQLGFVQNGQQKRRPKIGPARNPPVQEIPNPEERPEE